MKTLRRIFLLLLALTSLPALALSAGSQAQLERIQGRWAEINYQLPAKQREGALAELAGQAGKAVAAEPQAAELHIWHGIVLSTWAGAKGGLGALGLVKEAKARLEIAIKQDPAALDGSAYTSLGSLYYQVPGWPVGFGDDEKAEQLLKQALAINPTGIDPNFFYGDFLLDQGDKAQAKVYLDKALAAPARPGREVADEGRRMEIRERLAKL